MLWECSGGSVICGETSIVATKRELFEETGIDADIESLVYLGDTIRSNYIVDTYLYTLNEDIVQLKLQAEEVVDAMWVIIEQMESKKELIVDGVWDRYCQFKKKMQNS
jgi:ADP-ribose pyrophosphatase YjhB (NUDIX family)